MAMRDQAGIALERLLLSTEIEQNRLMIETDKLRSALLSSVSHDRRTPLVSIKGAASAMLELESTLGAKDQREFLVNILEQAERLNQYVQNLRDMTRLGYGAIKPKFEWCVDPGMFCKQYPADEGQRNPNTGGNASTTNAAHSA